jgi:hypothetical protein
MPWNAIIGMALVIVIIVVLVYNYQKRRASEDEELRRIAVASGFTFQSTGDQALVDEILAFPLLSDRGPAGSKHTYGITRVLSRETGGLTVFFFRLYHRVDIPADESLPVTNESGHDVILFRFAGRRLPVFSLRPAQIGDKVSALFGRGTISFEHDPEFSKRYVLQGDDEAAVKALFSDRLREFFLALPESCTVECGGDRMACSCRNVRSRIAPGTVRDFMLEGSRFLSIVLPSAPRFL